MPPSTAGLRAPSGEVRTTLLTQTAPGHYEARVPVTEAGAYEVRFLLRQGSTAASETTGFTILADPELRHAGINERLLAALANGRPYLRTAAQTFDPSGLAQPGTRREPLWGAFLAPALLLLLASVAVRRRDFRRPRRRPG